MPDALRDSLITPTASTAISTWVRPEDLAGCVDCTTTVDLAEVCAVTQEILFILSGRRYQQRRVHVRPHRRVESSPSWAWGGAGSGGWSVMTSGVGFAGWGGLEDPDRYTLELSGPVQAINEVKLDGVALPVSAYALLAQRALVRVDDLGGGRRLAWPADQRLDLPDTAVGTLSVDYTWGASIPRGGRMAARAYACQLATGLAGGECALPSRVVQLVRQGATFTRLDPFEFIDKGRTGIELVDNWLGAVNPRRMQRQSKVFSADEIMGVRT